MAEEEIKKEQQLLVRATVNYLFLAQFETFRASLIRLKQKHPVLSVAILQTVIEKGARIDGVAWSSRTSSPAHLTWLSIAELLNLETSTSADPQALQLKAEFLLLIESIKSRIVPQTLADQSQGPSNERNGEPAEAPAPETATTSEGDGSLLFFESLSSCGLHRLQAEIFKSSNNLPESLTESEVETVRRVARDHPELVAALCDNIQRQVNFQSDFASQLAISLYDHGKSLKEAEDDRLQSSGDRPPGESSSVSEKARDDFKLGLRIEEEAQLAHLDVLKESLERGDLESAIQRLRFLRQDNGLPSSMYWYVTNSFTSKSD